MKGNYPKALPYILRSLRIAANYGMREELARGNLDLAELYLAEGRFKDARAPVKITEKTATELKLPELLMDAYDAEFNLYAQTGNYKNALYYDNKKNQIKDSLFTIAKDKAINELEFKYQNTQKEKDIAALNVQNKLQAKIVEQQRGSITVLIIAAVLSLLLFVIAYNNFRIKNKANKRIQTLMHDLHHRVKNNLQVLSGLFVMQIESLNDESAKNALRENETRLASMNLIHNKLYLEHATTQIEMRDYLEKLLKHIKDSFGGDNITLRVDMDQIMLEADKAVAIGLIVNELATNAFKYAFDENGGEIYLALKQEGKSKLRMTLSDSGKGISDAHKQNETSFGLKLVNLMASQLSSALIKKSDKGTSYQMEIGI
jgi:two-component sensor histidine kinase